MTGEPVIWRVVLATIDKWDTLATLNMSLTGVRDLPKVRFQEIKLKGPVRVATRANHVGT